VPQASTTICRSIVMVCELTVRDKRATVQLDQPDASGKPREPGTLESRRELSRHRKRHLVADRLERARQRQQRVQVAVT